MTNQYRGGGHGRPRPGHPSCFPADKEKIVNRFFTRMKNEGTYKQLRKHPNTPVGREGLINHFMEVDGAGLDPLWG